MMSNMMIESGVKRGMTNKKPEVMISMMIERAVKSGMINN